MNYNTEKIEAVLNGSPETLSTDDISMIVVDLVRRIESLEDYVQSLSGEIQSLTYKPPSTTKTRSQSVQNSWTSRKRPKPLRVFTKEEQAKLKGGK